MTQDPVERDYNVIIVGAGIVGPALAVSLAKKKRKVLIIERDLNEPDRIVGELLQPGGVEALKKLGMEGALENIDAIPTFGYQVIYNTLGVNIPYPSTDLASGPKAEGRGFHHGKFVMNLRKLAREQPGVTMIQGTVTEVVKNPYTGHVLGVKVKEGNREKFYFASLTAISDGISSKFRKDFSDETPKVRSNFVGLILEDCKLPMPNHGHVVIGANHSPILLYQIGKNETRILCDVQGTLPSVSSGAMKEHLMKHVLPYLPEKSKEPFSKALETTKVRSMPNQYLPGSFKRTPGMLLIGDAYNMRHPLTGGGMTVGFKDAVLLGELLDSNIVPNLDDTLLVEQQLSKFLKMRKRNVATINTLAMALYSLFGANDKNLRVLQMGCFEYFQLGGDCIKGPVSLLSGLNARPEVLFYHFFAVAFYAIYLNFLDKGISGFPVAFVEVFTVLYTACVVFLPVMTRELL
jgi:squalene monooxygenase